MKLTKAQIEALNMMERNRREQVNTNCTFVLIGADRTMRVLERLGLARLYPSWAERGWIITEAGRAALERKP